MLVSQRFRREVAVFMFRCWTSAAYLSPPMEIVGVGLVGGRTVWPFCSEFTSYWVQRENWRQKCCRVTNRLTKCICLNLSQTYLIILNIRKNSYNIAFEKDKWNLFFRQLSLVASALYFLHLLQARKTLFIVLFYLFVKVEFSPVTTVPKTLLIGPAHDRQT